MTKKERYLTRPVRRINLSLPIVRTDSYEIYYTNPPVHTRQTSSVRPVTRQKPLIDIANNLKLNNLATTTTTKTINRSPTRLKHLTGPALINLIVDMPPIPTDTSSTVADSIRIIRK